MKSLGFGFFVMFFSVVFSGFESGFWSKQLPFVVYLKIQSDIQFFPI